ncbi:hypothetical protein D9M71_619880 [compost metagenome]
MDDADDLLCHIRHAVISDQAQAALFIATLFFQHKQSLHDSLDFQSNHHGGSLLHPLRTLMRLADIERREIQDGRFLVNGAAIRKHSFGSQLQLVVVLETKRLQQTHVGMERHAQSIDALLCSGMGRNDDRIAVMRRHGIEHID